MFHGNVRTLDEVRRALGDEPYTEEHLERSHFKMFEEPLALLKGMGPGSAASQTLAEHPSSNVSPEAVKKEQTFAEQTLNKQLKAKAAGRPTTRSKSGSARKTSASKSRPSNQHGTRSSAKTNRDLVLHDSEGQEVVVTCDFDPVLAKVAEWQDLVYAQYKAFAGKISLDVIAETTLWRLRSTDG